MIISRWTDMGPEWKTEDIFRIRELFRENHISFRMPFSDLFFTSVFHMPEKDKRWGIRVREKDRSKAAALLIRENLACGDLLRGIVEEPRRPEKDGCTAAYVSPVLSRSLYRIHACISTEGLTAPVFLVTIQLSDFSRV